MDLAVRSNVGASMAAILRRSPMLFHLVDKGRLATAKAVYRLESGRVEFLK
jgi:carbonic anhydrase